jgi:hypothetical protein
MIRFLFRFVGLLGLALAFVFLVYDGTKSIANRTVEMTTVERFWNEVYAKSPQDVLRPLTAPIANWLWDPVMVSILGAPLWLILTILASLLMIVGRKRKPLIGYARDRS